MNSDEPHSENSVPAAAPLPIMQAIQQLMQERKQVEQFVEESYARLNALREQVRAEKAAADAEFDKKRSEAPSPQDKSELEHLRVEANEWRKIVADLQTQLDQVRGELDGAAKERSHLRQEVESSHAERDAACGKLEPLDRELSQRRVERETMANELAQLKHRVEHQTRLGGEFEELLQALVMEVGQREEAAFAQRRQFEEEGGRLRDELKTLQEHEQSLNEQLSKAREMANKVAQTQQDGTELAETAALIEQVEAEIRQQQETVRKERDAVAKERSEVEAWRNQLEEWRRAMQKQYAGEAEAEAAPEHPAHAAGPRMLQFTCKHCSAALQAKEWLAGLVTKCQHCGKMAPVPKVTS
jgi:colicin import membrane protein